MTGMIRVQPAPSRRRAFARWAVAQRPKLRTVGPNAFAVPPRLFAAAPEGVLLGALVDGQRYVPRDRPPRAKPRATARPGTKAATPNPNPGPRSSPPPRPSPPPRSTEPVGPGEPPRPRDTTPQSRGPAVPDTCAPPPESPLTTAPDPATELPAAPYPDNDEPYQLLPPAEHAPGPPGVDSPAEMFPCDGCDREFTTEHGRLVHRRRKHPEES